MSQTITRGRLRIDANFKRFVDEEVLPGVELDAAAFWHNVDEIVHDLAPENRQLLAERDRIQAALDEWHRSNPGPVKDKAAYKSFLRELGYWCHSLTTLRWKPRASTAKSPVRRGHSWWFRR